MRIFKKLRERRGQPKSEQTKAPKSNTTSQGPRSGASPREQSGSTTGKMGNHMGGGHQENRQIRTKPETYKKKAQEEKKNTRAPQPDSTSGVRFEDLYRLKNVVSRNIPELPSLMQIVLN